MGKEMEGEWRVIPSHPDYMVSEYGDVRRIDNNHLMKPYFKRGYVHILIRINKKRIPKAVHIFVAEAFIGPRPDGYHVHHKNHKKTPNHYTNLEYLSPYNHINEHQGEMQFLNRKLTPQDVIKIRSLYKGGDYTQKQLGNLFGVSNVQVHKIVRRKDWKQI